MPNSRFAKQSRGTAVASFFLLAGLRAFAGLTLTNLPDYQIGETARMDLPAPAAMTVIDAERTEALRFKEALKVPAIYRIHSNVVVEVEADFRHAVFTNRENFLTAVETAYKKRTPGAAALAQPRFARLVGTFQRENRSFPLTTNLARLWALGESEEVLAGPWGQKLHEWMARPIRAAELTNENKQGPYQFRLITAPEPVQLDLATVEQQCKPLARSNFITLGRLRGDFQKNLPPEERAAGKFAAAFLKANTFLEEDLTRQARLKKTETIWSVKHYEAGEAILRDGEVVDGKARAALEQLRAQAAVVELKDREAAAVQAAAALAALPPPQKEWPATAVWSGAAAVAVVAGFVLWRRFRSGRNRVLALTRLEGSEAAGGALTPAELRPHLARFFSLALVQRMFRQRTSLVQTQQIVAAQTVELEQRLTKIQSHMQERFHAYERRIADLEKELAAAEEENRDLIRAKIVLAKQDLAFERAKGGLSRN